MLYGFHGYQVPSGSQSRPPQIMLTENMGMEYLERYTLIGASCSPSRGVQWCPLGRFSLRWTALEHDAPRLLGASRKAVLRRLRRVDPRAGAAVGGHAGPVQHADQGQRLRGRVCLRDGPAGRLAGPHRLGHAGRAHRAGQRGLRPAAVQRRELHGRVHNGCGRLGRNLLRSAHSNRHPSCKWHINHACLPLLHPALCVCPCFFGGWLLNICRLFLFRFLLFRFLLFRFLLFRVLLFRLFLWLLWLLFHFVLVLVVALRLWFPCAPSLLFLITASLPLVSSTVGTPP